MEVRYETAPNGFGPSWKRYIDHGISPGSFGKSILCNDLVSAVRCADVTNRQLITEHVQWCWNNLPFESWGDYENYCKWSGRGGLKNIYPSEFKNEESNVIVLSHIREIIHG